MALPIDVRPPDRYIDDVADPGDVDDLDRLPRSLVDLHGLEGASLAVGEPARASCVEIEGADDPACPSDLDAMVPGAVIQDGSCRTDLGAADLDPQRAPIHDERRKELDILSDDDDPGLEHLLGAVRVERLISRFLNQLADANVVDVSLRIHVGPPQWNVDDDSARHDASSPLATLDCSFSSANISSTMSDYFSATTPRRTLRLVVTEWESSVSSWSRIANFLTVSQRSRREFARSTYRWMLRRTSGSAVSSA